MIEIEIRHLGDHEILHAMPAGNVINRCLLWFFIMVYLIEAGLLILRWRWRRRVSRGDAGCAGPRRALYGDEQARLGQFWHILHGSLTEFAGCAMRFMRQGWWPRSSGGGRGIDGRYDGAGDHDASSRSEVVACLMGSAISPRWRRPPRI
jgi:hypothetical protein